MASKQVTLITLVAVVLIVSTAFYAIWQFQLNALPAVDRETLFQLAVWDKFISGEYGGFVSFSELAKHGDFGIGTLDGLDGEMIVLNGVFYHIPLSGIPRQIDPSETSPYAAVTFFDADITLTVSNLNYTQLKAFIDANLPSEEAIYAIKVSGTYDYALTRAPAKQAQPYPVLADALKNQAIFTLNNISATAVGLWFPESMTGVDYVGYHLHIITNDYAAGGHVIDFIIANATVEIDQINNYNLVLPK